MITEKKEVQKKRLFFHILLSIRQNVKATLNTTKLLRQAKLSLIIPPVPLHAR